jgi:hypothetical protein
VSVPSPFVERSFTMLQKQRVQRAIDAQERKSRLRIVKLEERIAPRCRFNAQQGRPVGNCPRFG